MTTHIALLRGVNVAGQKLVAMSDLRNLLAKLGFLDGRSLLQSGNLVFRGAPQKGGELERLLKAEAEKQLGLRTDFFVRTAKEWSAIAARNPFRDEAAHDPGRLVVMFLKDAPTRANVELLQAAIKGPETVRVVGREAYIVYPNGIGRSQVANAFIDRKLGTRGTGRNWNTVQKLAALATD
jgi:uncharacterized protein (DUF1697 family)